AAASRRASISRRSRSRRGGHGRARPRFAGLLHRAGYPRRAAVGLSRPEAAAWLVRSGGLRVGLFKGRVFGGVARPKPGWGVALRKATRKWRSWMAQRRTITTPGTSRRLAV